SSTTVRMYQSCSGKWLLLKRKVPRTESTLACRSAARSASLSARLAPAALIALGRELAGLAPIGLLEALGELLVDREGKIERPVPRRDQADRRVALSLAQGLVAQREAAVERHGLGQARLVVLLHESNREPARIEGEDRVRLEARDAGELGGEIELG